MFCRNDIWILFGISFEFNRFYAQSSRKSVCIFQGNLAPSSDDVNIWPTFGLFFVKISAQYQWENQNVFVFPLALCMQPPFFWATYIYIYIYTKNFFLKSKNPKNSIFQKMLHIAFEWSYDVRNMFRDLQRPLILDIDMLW